MDSVAFADDPVVLALGWRGLDRSGKPDQRNTQDTSVKVHGSAPLSYRRPRPGSAGRIGSVGPRTARRDAGVGPRSRVSTRSRRTVSASRRAASRTSVAISPRAARLAMPLTPRTSVGRQGRSARFRAETRRPKCLTTRDFPPPPRRVPRGPRTVAPGWAATPSPRRRRWVRHPRLRGGPRTDA